MRGTPGFEALGQEAAAHGHRFGLRGVVQPRSIHHPSRAVKTGYGEVIGEFNAYSLVAKLVASWGPMNYSQTRTRYLLEKAHNPAPPADGLRRALRRHAALRRVTRSARDR
jgi:hypothetical protein